jgi:2-octaprenyl-6-methoxyphenol hydroxylase
MLPVAVVGAGPVGLAFALSMQRAGIDCTVLDARAADSQHSDPRILALSHGSRQILERLGAWGDIDATPIATIHVSQRNFLGRTLIHARDAGVPTLGYVVEAATVCAALERACTASGVHIRRGIRATGSLAQAECALLYCTTACGSEEIRTQLIAWAEGATRSEDAIVRRDYAQQAIVATVLTRDPIEGIAYERFTTSGPVALLPLGDRYALVWTVPDGETAGLLALDEHAFIARLNSVFSGRLALTTVSARTAYPLGLRYRKSPVGKRAVWLGNAAQTLHPVAGQGFNLALRDVSQLARLLQDHPQDCAEAALLARYAAARRLDRGGTIGFTDGLIRLFGVRGEWAAHARSAGLLALDLLPAARRFVAQRMIFGARGGP